MVRVGGKVSEWVFSGVVACSAVLKILSGVVLLLGRMAGMVSRVTVLASLVQEHI